VNDLPSVANPALPKRPRTQRNALVVIFVALICAVQAQLLLWVIPNFAKVFRDMLAQSRVSPAHALGGAHALPPITRFILKLSTTAVHFESLTILLCAVLALVTLCLFFHGHKTRLLATVLLVSLFLFTLLEVFAIFLPMRLIIKALGHK
jgi:type II secretory pathway component PulF